MRRVAATPARVHLAGGEVIDAPGYPVQVYNILGAGDAFGAGFLYGCANFMPTYDEVMAFVNARGGL